MAKFEIYLVKRLFDAQEAENETDILKLLNKLHPDFKVETIFNTETGKTTDVDTCEGCGKCCLDEDIDIATDEGDYCKDCSEAIREEMKTHEVRCINEDCGWSGMKNDLQSLHMKLYKRCPRCDEYKYLIDTKTNHQLILK